MSTARCGINSILTVICRDEDTALGGLDPIDTKAPSATGFFRMHNRTIDDVTDGEAIDRRVEIDLQGTGKVLASGNNYGKKMRHQLGVTLRVGYYAGDNMTNTSIRIAEDMEQIFIALRRTNGVNQTPCDCGCIEGMLPISYSVTKLGNDRLVAEAQVMIQLHTSLC